MVRLLSSNPDVPEDEDCGESVPGAARGLLTEARVQRPEPQRHPARGDRVRWKAPGLGRESLPAERAT